MSTRWYPIWQKGNPQLRVFLPNFWMKIVKHENSMPKNMVTFHVSIEMVRICRKIVNYSLLRLVASICRQSTTLGTT